MPVTMTKCTPLAVAGSMETLCGGRSTLIGSTSRILAYEAVRPRRRINPMRYENLPFRRGERTVAAAAAARGRVSPYAPRLCDRAARGRCRGADAARGPQRRAGVH